MFIKINVLILSSFHFYFASFFCACKTESNTLDNFMDDGHFFLETKKSNYNNFIQKLFIYIYIYSIIQFYVVSYVLDCLF